MLSDCPIELTCFNSIEGVRASIRLVNELKKGERPNAALVDLRLSSEDLTYETYNSNDLSGFLVIDELLKTWNGLPVVVASASSKLWNVEKAIRRGAVAYWRKSDEVHELSNEEVTITALDINDQFVDKLTLAIRQARYSRIFRINQLLMELCEKGTVTNIELTRSITNYCNNAPRKISWMLWQDLNENEVCNSLFLGVMEIFNELESSLWDKIAKKMVLFPDARVAAFSDIKDSQIINKTLSRLDKNYDIGGRFLASKYETLKGIRNHLPIIHGSRSNGSAEDALVTHIEGALLIVLAVLKELDLHFNPRAD
jgi:CheY-like chemotaxis protein